jgi:serine/arginine repetitive matrix protein 1
MHKVNLAVIRPWVAKKIVELVGFEDELVVEYAMGLLEDESQAVRASTKPPIICG